MIWRQILCAIRKAIRRSLTPGVRKPIISKWRIKGAKIAGIGTEGNKTSKTAANGWWTNGDGMSGGMFVLELDDALTETSLLLVGGSGLSEPPSFPEFPEGFSLGVSSESSPSGTSCPKSLRVSMTFE